MRTLPLLAPALLLTALLLAACGGTKPEALATPGESKVAAKAVADVDGAAADAQPNAPAQPDPQ